MAELWIRNQSRNQLIKPNHIYIDSETQIWGDNCWLGDYQNEKRALEVLDEIQEILTTRQCSGGFNEANLLYEMPKN